MLKQKIITFMAVLVAMVFISGSFTPVPVHAGAHNFLIVGHFYLPDDVQKREPIAYILDWAAKEWHIVTDPDPENNSQFLRGWAINDSKEVVGRSFAKKRAYYVNKADYNNVDFTYYYSDDSDNLLHFGLFESKRVRQTTFWDINNYCDKVGWHRYPKGQQIGHLITTNGEVFNFQHPETSSTMPQTRACGVNDNLDIVGVYNTEAGTTLGFLKIGDLYTNIGYPKDETEYYETHAIDINNMGQIVGYYKDDAGTKHGYFLDNGVFTIFNFPLDPNDNRPHITSTRCQGLNDEGLVVGMYQKIYLDDGSEGPSRGFLTNTRGTVYRALNFPGNGELPPASDTFSNGITNNID